MRNCQTNIKGAARINGMWTKEGKKIVGIKYERGHTLAKIPKHAFNLLNIGFLSIMIEEIKPADAIKKWLKYIAVPWKAIPGLLMANNASPAARKANRCSSEVELK